jgi:hypothetical protein
VGPLKLPPVRKKEEKERTGGRDRREKVEKKE